MRDEIILLGFIGLQGIINIKKNRFWRIKMNTTLTNSLPLSEQDLANIFKQALTEGVKSMPKPELPSWIQGIGDFIKMHPGMFTLIVIAALSICFFIVRELVCSYLKTNEILARLKRIEEKR